MDPRNIVLHYVSFSGGVDAVRKLIAENVDINGRDENGNAAVHKAAEGNQLEILEMLLLNGADINAVNDDGRTCLHASVEKRALDCVQLLLSKEINVNHLNKKGHSALMTAIGRGLCYDEDGCIPYSLQEEKMISLLINKTNIDLKQIENSSRNWNSLHYAAYWGCKSAVKTLLEKDPTLNDFSDGDGDYPIHLAAMTGQKEVIQLILRLVPKININLRGCGGTSTLHVAAANQQFSTAEMLISENVDCNLGDDKGQTPLYAALDQYTSCCLNKLTACAKENKLEYCIEIRKVYDSMADVFKKRCVWLAFAVFLIQKGNGDVYAKMQDGPTPLDQVANDCVVHTQLKALFEKSIKINSTETPVIEKIEKISRELEKVSSKIDEIDRVLKVKTAALEMEITDLKEIIKQYETYESEASEDNDTNIE